MIRIKGCLGDVSISANGVKPFLYCALIMNLHQKLPEPVSTLLGPVSRLSYSSNLSYRQIHLSRFFDTFRAFFFKNGLSILMLE